MALLKRSLQSLRQQATTRPAGYMGDVLARAERMDSEHYWIDPQAYLDLCRRWEAASLPTSQPSKSRQIINMARSAARATRSVARTNLGINRASHQQVEVRLDVCRQCPGNHAIWKNGDVHTCGPMLQSMADNGGGTCGCILRRKARDLIETCPFGWWPEPPIGTPLDPE